MRGARGSIIIVLSVFGALLVQSTFARVLAPQPFAPYLGLPVVFALAVAPGVPALRGAATAFALGYLQDLFTGNPMGIHTFVFVAGYFIAWLVGYLLSFRGIVFEMVLTFFLTAALGGLIELVRDFTPGGISRDALTVFIAIVASSVATALVAPVVFAAVRWIDPDSERAPT